MRRREVLVGMAASGLGLLMPGCATSDTGRSANGANRSGAARIPALARSLPEEHDYSARVTGRIPLDLRGTLYRNGPGLFDRDGFRKRCLLDGDGMVQAFRFGDGGVRYRNRYVRTEKYLEEEAAGRFLYQTWTTEAPGGWLANLGIGDFLPSAGVNVVPWAGRLYALEDASHPYRMDPVSLDTEAADRFGVDGGIFNAHPKIDPAKKQWIHTGLGVTSRDLHITVLDESGRVVTHRREQVDRGTYIHDFFATEKHIVVVLSPLGMAPLGFLLGRDSVAGSFTWDAEAPNLLYVFSRERDGELVARLEAPACWMWHSVNAYERGSEIVADFVGYDAPDHFVGDDPSFWALMDGRLVPAKNAGWVRRYMIDPGAGRVRTEVLFESNSEYPTVHPARSCGPYRHAYFARSHSLERGILHDTIAHVDVETGVTHEYALGADRYCGESVFVPKPGVEVRPLDAAGDAGWLLTVVYDDRKERTELTVIDAMAIEDGPVAVVHLEHHTPFSFHGSWLAAS